MVESRVVLVLAEPGDATADLVIEALQRWDVDLCRLDTVEFPQKVELVAFPGSATQGGYLHAGDRRVDLAMVRSVYRRSPAVFQLHAGMSQPEHRFAMMEAVQGFGGVLSALPCCWLNHPARVADATYKPGQLHGAAQCGLRVPRSLVTNVGHAAREFAEQLGGGVVYKPMSPGLLSEQGTAKVVNATRLATTDLDLEAIGRTAHLFQEWVPKVHDVRLTAVAGACFAVAIHASTDAAHVDWRADYDALTYHVVATPPEVQAGVQAYLHRFDLLFGAFDFGVTADGAWWFYECNPNGQWAWIAEETGLPIADAIARALVEGYPE